MTSDSTFSKPTNDDVVLLRKAEVARRLGVTVWTIDRWAKSGLFPKPIYLMPGSPARWRFRDIEAFIDKRKMARRVKPSPRGMLKQGAPRVRVEARPS